MKHPLVSVIVPTKNSEEFLDLCLQSVKNQTYKNIELIVVDNSSTDGTKDIAKKYTVNVFNKGPERSAQVNFGVTKAKGQYVYKVDSDFVLDNKVVKECVDKTREGFDAVVVHNTPDDSVSWIAKIRKFEVDMYKYDIAHSSARFVKKEFYNKIGGFNERITAGEDYDFQNKLNRADYKTGFIVAEALHLGEPKHFWPHMKKYYLYGKDFSNYKENNPRESKTQLKFVRSIYKKNWRKFVKHPLRTSLFFYYISCKFIFGGLGYLGNSKVTLKTVTPNLISIDTDRSGFRGAYIFKNLNFFPQPMQPAKFHYKIQQGKIKSPSSYDFRNGYYKNIADEWFYERSLLGLKLKFHYNQTTRTFTYNRAYRLIRFELGSIIPFGKHLSDIITINLLLSNICVARGFAFMFEDEVVCGIAPSFNGKTSLLKNVVDNGGKYIAEDILLLDNKNRQVYTTEPFDNNYGRKVNKLLNTSLNNSKIILEPQKFSRIILLSNLTSARKKQLQMHDPTEFFMLNSQLFNGNLFAKTYIFVNQLGARIQKGNDKISGLLHGSKIDEIRNFNFSKLIQDTKLNEAHWQKLGSKYSKAWKPLAKQRMSKCELSFINNAIQKDKSKVLDVGIGNGRIIKNYLIKNKVEEIYGIDIAKNMVDLCVKNLRDSRIKDLRVVNISTDKLPYKTKFEVISAIRVLKYNSEWRRIIQKLSRHLNTDGVLIFSVSNKNSLNRFSKYDIKSYKTTLKELKTLTKEFGLEIIDAKSFTRVPDKFYDVSDKITYQKLIILTEKILQAICGSQLFGRELFVAVNKKSS